MSVIVPSSELHGQGKAEIVSERDRIYASACSACHGADGKGASAARVGFEEPLPDFTDCSFATREPDGDWLAIAHEGGPVRGFAAMMPAFGEALSERQLQLALDHIRTFCRDDSWPAGELNLPRPLITEKAYPEDEVVIATVVQVERSSSVMNELLYEKRVGARGQVELAVPFGWKKQPPEATGAGDWAGSLGDLALAYKRVLFHDLGHGSIFSLSAEVRLPTGKEEEGFGKGTTLWEPFLTYGQILPGDGFFHFQGGLELPADSEAAEREAFLRFALGKSFAQARWGRTWSPMVEVLTQRELESGASLDWDLLPQVQVTLNRRQHLMLNVGVQLPVTDPGSRDIQVLFYFLWDWFDGGIAEGW